MVRQQIVLSLYLRLRSTEDRLCLLVFIEQLHLEKIGRDKMRLKLPLICVRASGIRADFSASSRVITK